MMQRKGLIRLFTLFMCRHFLDKKILVSYILIISGNLTLCKGVGEMRRGKYKTLFGFFLLLIAGFLIFMIYDNQSVFTGSRIKNPDEYYLDIQKMNGTDQHTMNLQKKDTLQIEFETVKGSLYMEIKASNGTKIYSGNGKEITNFTVNIPQSDVYTITIEATHAKGTIHVQLQN